MRPGSLVTGSGQRTSLPLGRIGAFYFGYFAILGAMVPYWPPYLMARGYTPRQIGYLLAIATIARILAPYLWGWLADVSGRRMQIVRLAAWATPGAFAAVWLADGFVGMAVVMLLYSACWHACLPLFEANTMAFLRATPQRYGQVRLWGSLGFIAVVTAGGLLFERVSVIQLPWLLLVAMLFTALVASVVPAAADTADTSEKGSAGSAQRPGQVVIFLLICFLMQASHGGYYTFFTIYLADLGYAPATVGLLWSLGVMAEVGVFLWLARSGAEFDVIYLLRLALALAVVRWLLLGWWADSTLLLLLAQTLHAATFGVFHLASMALLQPLFSSTGQGRAQALYSGAGFGAGGAAGGVVSGLLWSDGGASAVFGASAAMALLGFFLASFMVLPRAAAPGPPAA